MTSALPIVIAAPHNSLVFSACFHYFFVVPVTFGGRPHFFLKIATPSAGYGGVIKRIGTGEDPDTVGVEVVAVLLQPATFIIPFGAMLPELEGLNASAVAVALALFPALFQMREK
jgi:hypothetical protein